MKMKLTDMSKFNNNDYYYHKVINFMCLLASDYNKQKQCFNTDTNLAYEISEYWEDNELDLYAEYQIEYVKENVYVYKLILEIINDFVKNSNNSDVWDQSKMERHIFWDKQRRAAHDILIELKEPLIIPQNLWSSNRGISLE